MFSVHIPRVCIGCKNPAEDCADSFNGSIKVRRGTMRREKRKTQSLYERQHEEMRNGISQAGVITYAKCSDKSSKNENSGGFVGTKDLDEA